MKMLQTSGKFLVEVKHVDEFIVDDFGLHVLLFSGGARDNVLNFLEVMPRKEKLEIMKKLQNDLK